MKSREELRLEYEEALFEMLMDELMEAEGEVCNTKAYPEEFSEDLDVRCREAMECAFDARDGAKATGRLRKGLRIMLAAAAAATLLFSTVYATVPQVRQAASGLFAQVDVDSYPYDTKSRYIAGLALKFEVPYEDAAVIAHETAEELNLQSHEELRYKTIDKKVNSVVGLNGYAQEVRMRVDVRYVYDTQLEMATLLESVGWPELYLPDVMYYTIGESGYNVDLDYVPNAQRNLQNPHPYKTFGRISRTTNLTYKVKRFDIEEGWDVALVKHRWSFSEVSTAADTYVLEIVPSDFK